MLIGQMMELKLILCANEGMKIFVTHSYLFRMKIYSKGKIKVSKCTAKGFECQLEWPRALGVTEDDCQLVMSLMIVWRHIPWDKLKDQKLLRKTQVQLDNLANQWLKIDSNFCDMPNVHHYSLFLLAAIVTHIWQEGLDCSVLRHYQKILVKAAKDIELSMRYGFKKLVHVRSTTSHRTIRDGYLLRKVATPIYVVNVYCLTRGCASVNEMSDFLSIEKQGKELLKEMYWQY